MKTNKSLFSFLSAFVALVMVFGSYSAAYAQKNGLSIKISPVLFDELTAAPGESLSGTVTLSNPGAEQLMLYPGTRNFIPDPTSEEGVPKLTTESTPYALQDWITFDKQELKLAPGAKEDIRFTVDIPKNAQPGGHYGSLVFSTKAPQGAPESTQLKVESAVSALVLLTVSGDVKENGEVEFSNTRTADNKIEFTLRFKNTGNTHVKPSANITITNWLNSTVGEVKIEGQNVLPDSSRVLTGTWDPQGSLFGKYTAKLDGKYGSSSKTFSAVTYFEDYHFTTLLVILIIILVIILFIKMSSSKDYQDELSKEIKEDMKQ